MPLSDLLQAADGLLLVSLLPGFALATLAAPRWGWWERLAAAPGISAGAIGVLGLIYRDLHLGFRAVTVLPVLAMLVPAAWWRVRRTRSEPRVGPVADRGAIARVTAVALVAGAFSAAILSAGLRGSPLPLERDGAIHGTLANAIASSGDTLPQIPEPADGGAWVRVRTGLESQAALVSELGGPTPAGSLLPLTLVAVLLLPLGIAALAWETSGSAALAMASSAVALLSAFPAWPITFGELPLVVDTAVVVPLVLAAIRCVDGRRTADAVAMAACAVAANWTVHGTEVVTATLIGAPLLALAIRGSRQSGGPRRGALLLGACTAVALAVTLITRPPVVQGMPSTGAGTVVAEQSDFGSLVGHRSFSAAIDELTGFQPGWQLLALLAAAGALAAVRQRRMRWAILVELVVLATYVDSVSIGVLRPLWVRLYPWSTDDRIMDLQVFPLALLAGLGAVTCAEWLATRRGVPQWRLAGGLAVGAAAVIGLGHARDLYADARSTHPVITATDVTAMQAMSRRLPTSAVVLSDDSDAGVWISALTPQQLYMSWPYLRSHPDEARVMALSRACTDPQSIDPALFHGVDAVYIGASQVAATHPWDTACIARLPWLRVVVSTSGPEGTATVLAVTSAANPQPVAEVAPAPQ